jgi:hypothetical protein
VSIGAIAYHPGIAKGICQEHSGEGVEDSAPVDYGAGTNHGLFETIYRSNRYQPPFDELPWMFASPVRDSGFSVEFLINLALLSDLPS